MTSLIDIIFLLLLFFMLTSTFSKFSEVELSAASTGAAPMSDVKPLFLRLGQERLTLNGDALDLAGLISALPMPDAAPVPLLISLQGDVTAQRLTDLLVTLRAARGVVPGGSGGHMKRGRERTRREPTIALINIVFLMLVFFMVAGTLAQPLDRNVKLILTADLEGRAPPDALVIYQDGTLSYRGASVLSPAAFMLGQKRGAQSAIRIVPDRALPARDLVRITRALRNAGAGRVLVVTERGLE